MNTSPMRFHHFGVACRSLDAEQRALVKLGYLSEGDDFVDPAQGVRGRFLTGSAPRLELLVDLPGSSTLQPWLQKGVRIYHQAFEVDDLDESLAALKADGARLVSPPIAAVAFHGRRVCFLMMRNLLLVELIEAAHS